MKGESMASENSSVSEFEGRNYDVHRKFSVRV